MTKKNQTDFWNEFQENNLSTFDVGTLGGRPEMREFLANRLWHAHTEGVSAGIRIERERLKKAIIELLFGNE